MVNKFENRGREMRALNDHSRVSNLITSKIVVQEESQADISTAIVGDVDQETGHPGGRESSDDRVDL